MVQVQSQQSQQSRQYQHLQTCMLALYSAGLCALHHDLQLAQRSLETADEMRSQIDRLLDTQVGVDTEGVGVGVRGTTGGAVTFSDGVSVAAGVGAGATTVKSATTFTPTPTPLFRHTAGCMGAYHTACGDLSLHLGHVYLRQHRPKQAAIEALRARALYVLSEGCIFLTAMETGAGVGSGSGTEGG
ncbi:hypothetical protein B484DRAFT_405337 [Ochromonadaceae sp. CCMP2298]|nr:hypothetical protein B484DRAFT_405337 [Ochromonadaceae sp. CCMP2298]